MKSFLKKIATRLYRIGRNEVAKEERANRQKQLDELMTFDHTVLIDDKASIINHRHNKKLITIGSNSWFRGQIIIFGHGGEIKIGKDCFIGEDSRIWSSVSITIGDRVLISHNVNIHDNVSHSLNSKKRNEEFLHIRKSNSVLTEVDLSEKSIEIGDDVWIGFNATILKGVKIGKGAIIGAGVTVTHDIPEYAVVVGNPARIIKYTE